MCIRDSYNVLLRACARAGDVTRAGDVMREIQASPRLENPSDRSWRECLRAAATARQADDAERIWREGISYHREHRLVVDEPQQRWIPSVQSLQALLMAYIREADATVDDLERKRELYERVVLSYHDVLTGEREMGFYRLDPMEMLDDRLSITLVIHALAALRGMVDINREAELCEIGHPLLQLDCLQGEPSLSRTAQQDVDALQSWCRLR